MYIYMHHIYYYVVEDRLIITFIKKWRRCTSLTSQDICTCSNLWVTFNQYAAQYAKVDLGIGYPDYAPSRFIQQALSDVALDGNKYLQYTREKGHLR